MPSSCPTKSLIFDSVRLFTPPPFSLVSIAVVVRLGSGGVMLLAQRLLVDLTDARFRDLLHEQDLVRYAVFRDYALVSIDLHMGLDIFFGRRRAGLRVWDHKCERTLSPFLVLDADYRDFRYAAMLRDDILELERGNPLAAGFDDVLDTIGDLYIAVGTDVSDVVGVQISAGPQLLGCLEVVEIALGQPWSSRDDLARSLAVASHFLHVGIDDTEIDQRNGEPRPGPNFHLCVGIARQMVAFKMRHREDGACLRHAVSRIDVDTSVQSLQGEGLGQGGTTYHHGQSR